ncbi:RepB family plasmid replication initiator protein [Sphingomonas sp. MA1305]|uniref:replication initiation protein n=1 Tax=Sphingomonas sp. MA1305 TaxID=2479204 RepID=UPI0018DF2351|nr:RepB family plasmid replication initiator protein [Sphingomonas sp. MA1305]
MRVAAALSAKRSDDFAKPGKLVEVRFVRGNSLSLTASRLLALMILTAGGDAWRDMPHRLRKADIRRGHKGNERISDMLEELHRTLFAEDDRSWRGKKATRRFSLIQMSREETDEDGGVEAGWIEWEFTPDARKLIQESETYAVLNRQAVLGFRSSYALKLYEVGALRIHRRQPVWRTDMAGLRAALGIPPDVYKDFAQLRRKVLQTAKAEIDQLAHFRVEWSETRAGRTVVELEFRFEPKDAPAQLGTVDELSRHSGGRRARRDGTVETLVEGAVAIGAAERSPPLPAPSPRLAAAPAVPAITPPAAEPGAKPKFAAFPGGSLRYADGAEFLAIGRAYGGGWDVDLIAQAYRAHMGERIARLSGVKLQRSWQGFCESYVTRKGRPQ